jgi:Uma2 family endonuclease
MAELGVMTAAPLDLALRSLDASWDRTRWERLPADGRRYEVIDGVLYVSTTPSFFHQWIIRQMVRVLFAQVDDAGVGITMWAPIGVFMPGCDPVQPDVLVIRQTELDIVHDRRVFGVPALLAEILSPGNAQIDTETKRTAYARAGVPEYWIVRPSERDVLCYSEPDAALGDYAQSLHVRSDGEPASPTLPVRLAVGDLFAGAPDTTV